MGIEKRAHVRFEARLRVELEIEGATLTAYTRDLSLGGMFLQVPRGFPVTFGQALTARVYFPALAAPAPVRCVVRWSTATGVGVAFEVLRAAETWAINQLAVYYSPQARP
ncbi:MAG: PilZ domain-containing protein [Deltaproteobacteria bacterium]|nr:PilZ domain-containing protein [Deltaproteobacteria bacterium]